MRARVEFYVSAPDDAMLNIVGWVLRALGALAGTGVEVRELHITEEDYEP